jgi:hypothetical protein
MAGVAPLGMDKSPAANSADTARGGMYREMFPTEKMRTLLTAAPSIRKTPRI